MTNVTLEGAKNLTELAQRIYGLEVGDPRLATAVKALAKANRKLPADLSTMPAATLVTVPSVAGLPPTASAPPAAKPVTAPPVAGPPATASAPPAPKPVTAPPVAGPPPTASAPPAAKPVTAPPVAGPPATASAPPPAATPVTAPPVAGPPATASAPPPAATPVTAPPVAGPPPTASAPPLGGRATNLLTTVSLLPDTVKQMMAAAQPQSTTLGPVRAAMLQRFTQVKAALKVTPPPVAQAQKEQPGTGLQSLNDDVAAFLKAHGP